MKFFDFFSRAVRLYLTSYTADGCVKRVMEQLLLLSTLVFNCRPLRPLSLMTFSRYPSRLGTASRNEVRVLVGTCAEKWLTEVISLGENRQLVGGCSMGPAMSMASFFYGPSKKSLHRRACGGEIDKWANLSAIWQVSQFFTAFSTREFFCSSWESSSVHQYSSHRCFVQTNPGWGSWARAIVLPEGEARAMTILTKT